MAGQMPARGAIGGRADIGAGWERAARDTGVVGVWGSPSHVLLVRPIYANLVQQDGDR
jgi:uncharacterized protein (DUF736 family)